MESLNLNTLASSLPPPNLANAEKDLMEKFKAAAFSITTLYRSSKRTSKRSYNSGYAAACQDLLLMVQHGVSEAHGSDENGSGMTIAKIMDWIEARLEAVKAMEEEEEEDEERERGRSGEGMASTSKATGPGAPKAGTSQGATRREQGTTVTAPLTPHSPPSMTSLQLPSNRSSPPSSPRIYTRPLQPRAPSAINATPAMNAKLRSSYGSSSGAKAKAKDVSNTMASTFPPTTAFNFNVTTSDNSSSPVALTTPNNTPVPITLPPSMDLGAGAKRRHEVMMMFNGSDVDMMSGENRGLGLTTQDISPQNPALTHTSTSRRRTRSSRGTGGSHDRERGQDAMDVEEEGGRERKRVTRR